MSWIVRLRTTLRRLLADCWLREPSLLQHCQPPSLFLHAALQQPLLRHAPVALLFPSRHEQEQQRQHHQSASAQLCSVESAFAVLRLPDLLLPAALHLLLRDDWCRLLGDDTADGLSAAQQLLPTVRVIHMCPDYAATWRSALRRMGDHALQLHTVLFDGFMPDEEESASLRRDGRFALSALSRLPRLTRLAISSAWLADVEADELSGLSAGGSPLASLLSQLHTLEIRRSEEDHTADVLRTLHSPSLRTLHTLVLDGICTLDERAKMWGSIASRMSWDRLASPHGLTEPEAAAALPQYFEILSAVSAAASVSPANAGFDLNGPDWEGALCNLAGLRRLALLHCFCPWAILEAMLRGIGGKRAAQQQLQPQQQPLSLPLLPPHPPTEDATTGAASAVVSLPLQPPSWCSDEFVLDLLESHEGVVLSDFSKDCHWTRSSKSFVLPLLLAALPQLRIERRIQTAMAERLRPWSAAAAAATAAPPPFRSRRSLSVSSFQSVFASA